ncbi:MAG: hypothetical protein H7Z19_04895 [Chitinophagaceae bacterium]|nr:hypothetical protein [Rubrivivax sp.]
MPASPAAPRWQPDSRGRLAAERSRPRARAAVGPVTAATLNPAQERGRRTVVRLVFLLFILVIVEGAIRKWVAPQWATYIFFLRDPFLLLTYFVATRHSLWPRRNLFFQVSLGLAILGVLITALQFATGGHSDDRVILGLYGWRAYFLYTPLAFLVGAQFRHADVMRLFKLLLWLAVPIAALVAAQFFSPTDAPINVGIAQQEELQFKGPGLTSERTRPQGPFASAAAQQQYVATAFAVLLAYFMSPRGLLQPRVVSLVVTGAGVLTCIALSGSRGLFIQCAISVLGALLIVVIGRGGALKGRALVWPTGLTVAALLAYPVVFPEGYSAFTERWIAASAAESQSFENTAVFGRALYGLVDFVRLVDAVPLLGTGMGFGGNAAITLRVQVDGLAPPYAETDFARHMVDLGPAFGMVYIVFRLLFAGYLTVLAVRAARRYRDPMPLLLWSYAASVIVAGQLTGQGTINFFGWLFAGLLIAAARPLEGLAAHQPSPAPSPRRPLPLRRASA